MAEAIAIPRTNRINAAQFTGPILILLILVMLVVPLPPWAISFLFAVNICAGLVILGASLYITTPAEFSSFPSILLATTLMRLGLNVATARAILLNGYTGPDAAGHVIESFGQFAVGGNYVVGGIIFVILIIINFVVVTKGASRVAEVSARFMLDSLPGRQLTIDSEVNAGAIDAKEAEKRRVLLRRDADFFGAMDGASKFVRGDVVAAMIILVVNMVGGLIIGTLQAGLPIADAARTYTLLTVGDGLAAQIPSLTISVAAGLVVTRVATGEDIGNQIKTQISRFPQALALAAVIMAAIGLMPGMAHFPFLLIASTVGVYAWRLTRPDAANADTKATGKAAPGKEEQRPKKAMSTISDVTGVDPLALSIGYTLTPLVGNGNTTLQDRLAGARERFGTSMGFLIPPVSIRDSRQLTTSGYVISIRGAAVAAGEIYRGQFLAIETDYTKEKLTEGRQVKDPIFGRPAVWIKEKDIKKAEELDYKIIEETQVLAGHLGEVLKKHCAELFGRPQLDALMVKLGETTPRLAEDLRNNLSLGVVRQVLTALLEENISIRDFERIAEALAEAADVGIKDPEQLLVRVRLRLGRSIVAQANGNEPVLRVTVLAAPLEMLIAKSIRASKESGINSEIEPNTIKSLIDGVNDAIEKLKVKKIKPILVVQSALRRAVQKTVGNRLPVLSFDEIPDSMQMQVVQTAGQADVQLGIPNG
jgi:flagellar biosynthesis protein FlhA